VLLPDDAVRDKVAGEGGPARLWAAAERAQEDLAAAEGGYRDDMLTQQEHFAESVVALSRAVDGAQSWTDIEQVRQNRDE
jgi:hypothetical protein